MNYYKIIDHSHYTRECIDAVHSEYNKCNTYNQIFPDNLAEEINRPICNTFNNYKECRKTQTEKSKYGYYKQCI